MTGRSKGPGCRTCAHRDIGGFCTQFVSLAERTFTNDGYWICSLYEASASSTEKVYNENRLLNRKGEKQMNELIIEGLKNDYKAIKDNTEGLTISDRCKQRYYEVFDSLCRKIVLSSMSYRNITSAPVIAENAEKDMRFIHGEMTEEEEQERIAWHWGRIEKNVERESMGDVAETVLQRVRREHIDLCKKIERLDVVAKQGLDAMCEEFGPTQASLLSVQACLMHMYDSVLEDRIADLERNE